MDACGRSLGNLANKRSRLADETPQEQYTRLEHRLVLLEWANRLLGYESNRDLLSELRQVDEGFDGQRRSYVTLHLLARGSKLRLTEDELGRYDANIRRHLEAMNAPAATRATCDSWER